MFPVVAEGTEREHLGPNQPGAELQLQVFGVGPQVPLFKHRGVQLPLRQMSSQIGISQESPVYKLAKLQKHWLMPEHIPPCKQGEEAQAAGVAVWQRNPVNGMALQSQVFDNPAHVPLFWHGGLHAKTSQSVPFQPLLQTQSKGN